MLRKLIAKLVSFFRRKPKAASSAAEIPPTPEFLDAPTDNKPGKKGLFSGLFKKKSQDNDKDALADMAAALDKPAKPRFSLFRRKPKADKPKPAKPGKAEKIKKAERPGLFGRFKRTKATEGKPAKPVQKPKKVKRKPLTEHWFWQPVRASWDIYRQVILASLLINLFSLASSLYIMTVYDRIIPNKAIESLWALSLIIFIILLFDFAVKTIRASLIDAAGARVDRFVSEKLFRRIARRNMDMSRQTMTGLNHIIRDFEVLKDVIGSASFTIFVDLPFILLFIFVLFYVGGPLAIIPATIVPLIILFGFFMQPMMRRQGVIALQEAGDKNLVVSEMVGGIETLKTIRGLDMLKNRWLNSVVNQGTAVQNSRFIGQTIQNVTQFGQQISQIGIVIFGVFLIADKSLTMGQLIACVILSGRTLAPLANLTQLISRLDQANVAFNNIDRLMHETSREEETEKFLKRGRLKGRIDVTNLTFQFEGKATPALRDVSLTINAGERVAILGRIGSGKSTLLNTIAGLSNVQDGIVRLGGVNLAHLRADDLRENIGIVLANPIFFSGTIRENILMGNPDATDADVLQAAKLAGADEFINDLPDGFDFHISQNGRELSSGMRQVLSIIRAIISQPAVLLLDEPTTSMDAQAEKLVVATLARVTQNMTCIIATHRGALLEIVDRVVIIDQGRVVADGPTGDMLERIQAEQG
ncbi:MAG: ATP-binding cassette domain-containing protein [Parvibaculales bacterium]